MGSAYVAVAQGPESVFSNPAGLTQTGWIALSFFVAHPFGLKELNYQNLSAALRTRYGCFGFALQTYGHNLYRENLLAIGWGNDYKKKIHYGFLARWNHLWIDNYGSDAALTFDAGCLLTCIPHIAWGVAATNLTRGRMDEQGERLPTILRVGVSYTPLSDLLLSVELAKETQFPTELRTGCEFFATANLSLRCGFGRDPSYFAAGIGLNWSICSLDYAFTIHPVLGESHQGSLSFNLNSVPRIESDRHEQESL